MPSLSNSIFTLNLYLSLSNIALLESFRDKARFKLITGLLPSSGSFTLPFSSTMKLSLLTISCLVSVTFNSHIELSSPIALAVVGIRSHKLSIVIPTEALIVTSSTLVILVLTTSFLGIT